ncbi:MAG: hypothetical protein KA419_05290 [Acidobacteria bacterium]|nr:hypothetical protein [Acidobacteriota bacterium]
MWKIVPFALCVLTLVTALISGQTHEGYSWGPVTAGGLRLGIVGFENPRYSGLVEMGLALRNSTQNTVYVPFWFPEGSPRVRIIAHDAAGKEFFGRNTGNTEYPPQALTDFRRVGPGSSAEIRLNIREGLKGMHALWHLKPGEYRLKAVLTLDFSDIMGYCRQTGLPVPDIGFLHLLAIEVGSGETTVNVP